MNTEQLKYFMEFAFYGTAEKTAAQLGVSRSSVSRNIKKLEEELGSKLFTAGVQGIVLTREGDLCLKYERLKMTSDLTWREQNNTMVKSILQWEPAVPRIRCYMCFRNSTGDTLMFRSRFTKCAPGIFITGFWSGDWILLL